MRNRSVFIVLYLSLIWSVAIPQVGPLIPFEDSYIRGGDYVESNFGNEPELIVKQGNNDSYSRKSFLKFDVSKIDPALLDSAILRMYPFNISGHMQVNLFEGPDSWNELSINWNNAPVTGREVARYLLDGSEVGSYIETDITSYVFKEILKDGILTLMLYDSEAHVQHVKFNSREASESKPHLSIINKPDPILAPPSDLAGIALDTGRISLHWSDNSHNELGFVIERKSEGGVFDSISSLDYGITEYIDAGLMSGTEYIYRIRAQGYGNKRSYSNELIIQTKEIPDGPPLVPTELKAVAQPGGHIRLDWQDNSTDEEAFIIERRTGSQEFSVVDTVDKNIQEYTDHGLLPLTTYSYRLYATNYYYDSQFSNEAEITTLAGGVTYYVNSHTGRDSNPGTSADSAWQSLDKMNSHIFSPGDSLLLARGSQWNGQLLPKGSGYTGLPIYIGSYGSGTRPRIDAGGKEKAGLLLHNVTFWEINGLEITNTDGSDGDQGELFGIYVLADEGEGTFEHIYINDCYIHDINGHVEGKKRGGIHVHIKSLEASIFHDLRITNNRLNRIGGVGIGNASDCGRIEFHADDETLHNLWTGVYVAHNHIDHTGRNSIIARVSKDAIYEYNVMANSSRHSTGHSIFCFNTYNIKIQYNEAYGNVGEGGMDRGGFDADYNCVNTYIQYNYSHDNLWFCGIMKRENRNVVIRYNISQNDRQGIYFYGFDNESVARNIHIYNNTHFVSSEYNVEVFPEDRTPVNTRFENNIFHFEGNGSWGPHSEGVSVQFNGNLYYNIDPHPSDTDPVTTNPDFTNPGTAGTGIETVSGFQLRSSSPAIDRGIKITDHGGIDFWGNSLYTRDPDIGAHEFDGTPTGLDHEKNSQHDPSLHVNPNPLSDKTLISFSLLYEQQVVMDIIDSTGRIVQTLVNERLLPGNYNVNWDGTDTSCNLLGNGLYVCNLRFPDSQSAHAVSRAIIISR
jgi:hypothetical protein